ncbi:hypothetical protein Y1Q_0002493 [Alligator mississippiensis]|uniref:Uncharacterized protein n=1 Tax=Alligator mississippiensis TaxID=8496 RepID=A0A151NBM4_ALLMI|nr:hypothetical protein Y1Q_0002493 [Alligator mississippiensis]
MAAFPLILHLSEASLAAPKAVYNQAGGEGITPEELQNVCIHVGGPPVQAQVPALPEDNLPESFGLKWQGSCEIWAPLNMGQKLNTKSDLASILKCGLVCPSHPDLDMSSIPLCHSNIQDTQGDICYEAGVALDLIL